MTDDPKNHPDEGSENNPESYKVGPGKPPKHSQFKKGQSGNPSGKQKRPESCRDLLKEEMDALVSARENGKAITLTRRKAWVKSVVNGTVLGNPEGIVTVTCDGLKEASEDQLLRCGNGDLPMRCRVGTEYAERRAGDQMALKVEGVVDGGVNAEEALG